MSSDDNSGTFDSAQKVTKKETRPEDKKKVVSEVDIGDSDDEREKLK